MSEPFLDEELPPRAPVRAFGGRAAARAEAKRARLERENADRAAARAMLPDLERQRPDLNASQEARDAHAAAWSLTVALAAPHGSQTVLESDRRRWPHAVARWEALRSAALRGIGQ